MIDYTPFYYTILNRGLLAGLGHTAGAQASSSAAGASSRPGVRAWRPRGPRGSQLPGLGFFWGELQAGCEGLRMVLREFKVV